MGTGRGFLPLKNDTMIRIFSDVEGGFAHPLEENGTVHSTGSLCTVLLPAI